MDGAWPKVLETRWTRCKVRPVLVGRRINEVFCRFETREYPAGTEGGRYQLWFDGRWAEDITRNMEAKKGAEVMSCLDGYIAETACTLEQDDQDLVCYSKTYTDDVGNVYSGRRPQPRGVDREPMPGVLLPGPDSIAYCCECLRRARCNYPQTNPYDLYLKTVDPKGP